MADKDQISILTQGVTVWNKWRKENPNVEVDLKDADLSNLNLDEVNLTRAELHLARLNNSSLVKAKLKGAHLRDAELERADFSHADLDGAKLMGANFTKAKLTNAWLADSNLTWTVFRKAHLENANFSRAKITWTVFEDAHLNNSNFEGADILEADFKRAQLRCAILERATIVQTNFQSTDLSNSWVYGVSAWDVNLSSAVASNLIITDRLEDEVITVDSLEIAQFMHLLLNNEKIREAIDTITTKVVLILGRFTKKRKSVLDAIHFELRSRGFIPVLFDFEKPSSKDTTGTVETIARLARFIIADLSDPSSIPHELATIIPFLRTTPVLPLRLSGSKGYTMFEDLQRSYPWVLDIYEYQESQSLIANLSNVIAPAEELSEKYRTTS